MNYILFGDQTRNHLLPFTFIRPIADIRVGILTIREKWEHFLGKKTSTLTEEYLSLRYPLIKQADNVLINANVFPSAGLIREIGMLKNNQTLVSGDVLIAHRLSDKDIETLDESTHEGIEPVQTKTSVIKLSNLWDIVSLNKQAIVDDYELITRGRQSQPVPGHVRISGAENVFVEEGATIEMAFINATEGPVYIGRNALIMDGAMLRGPLSVGEGSAVKMGAKIYAGSTIGPHSKVGGEMVETVIFGYSNKAHDGFLGHSVIGEWCNLGADTNASNLKNNYDHVRLWNYAENSFVNTGLQFCGLFMGDYSKCGINTMFNTGTVVGVYALIFGTGFMRNFIPSFSWGSVAGFSNVDIDKAVQLAHRVHARRGLEFSNEDEAILRNVYSQSFAHRRM